MKDNKISFRYLLIFIVAFCISIISATYAYFAFSMSNNNSISGDAAIVSMNLNVRKVFPNNESAGMVPQLSGNALEMALKQGCVDDNNNTICQVYNIYVKNNGSSTVTVDGSISFFSDINFTEDASINMPNLKWMLVSSVDEVNSTNSVLGNGTVRAANSSGLKFDTNLKLGSNAEKNYYIIIWVNEVDYVQNDQGHNFYGKVDFISSNGNGVTATFVEN